MQTVEQSLSPMALSNIPVNYILLFWSVRWIYLHLATVCSQGNTLKRLQIIWTIYFYSNAYNLYPLVSVVQSPDHTPIKVNFTVVKFGYLLYAGGGGD